MEIKNKKIYPSHVYRGYTDSNVYDSCEIIGVNFANFPYFKPIYFLNCIFYYCAFDESFSYMFDLCHFESCDFDGTFEASIDQCTFKNHTHIPYIPMTCPVEGDIIGWKVCHGQRNRTPYLVKLYIPNHAGRTSGFGSRKCRCECAIVLDILHIDGTPAKETTVVSYCDGLFKYTKEKWALPDSYDSDRQKICANGIHFFMERQEAINYYESELV